MQAGDVDYLLVIDSLVVNRLFRDNWHVYDLAGPWFAPVMLGVGLLLYRLLVPRTRRRQKSDWPIAWGHIQSASLELPPDAPLQVLQTRRKGYSYVTLLYSYSVQNQVHSGLHQIETKTRSEASKLVDDLTLVNGAQIAIRFDPVRPDCSLLPESSVETLLTQARTAKTEPL